MGKKKQTQEQVSNQTVTQTPTGAPFAAPILAQTGALTDRVMNQTAFTGDRVAAPEALDQYVAQWGDLAPRQATAQPLQVNKTHVDKNYQPGIDAGLVASRENQAALSPLLPKAYDQWNNVLSWQENPALQAMLLRLQQEHAEGAAASNNAIAYNAGDAGAYGLDMQRQQTWLAEQQQQELDSATAGLLWQDFVQNQNMLLEAPDALAGLQALNLMPAQTMLQFGNLGQENLAGAAATADYNAQVASNNQNAQLALQDLNNQEQRDAAYQQEEARVAEAIAAANAAAGRDQAGMDNDFLRWLATQELTQAQIAQLQGLMGIASSAPGGTTTSAGKTTTTATQSTSPWEIAASLGGAALQAFAPGGMFSGTLSALGGGTGASRLLPMPGPANIPALI